MKLLTILSIYKPIGVGLASTVIIGGGAIITINAINGTQEPEEVVIIEEQEEPTEEIITVEPGPVVIEPEQVVTPGELVTPEPEKPVQPTTPTPSKPATTTPTQPTTPAPTQPTQPSTPKYRYTSHIEFYKAYSGWCPQDVPADAYHQPLPKYVSLGYVNSYSNYKTFENAVVYAWIWKASTENNGGLVIDVFPQDIKDLPGDPTVTVAGMVLLVNTATGKVTWSQIRGPAQADDGTAKRLDLIASQMETRLKQLDQQYYAKCGY